MILFGLHNQQIIPRIYKKIKKNTRLYKKNIRVSSGFERIGHKEKNDLI